MRNNITTFAYMAQDKTNTYQYAKEIFNTLALKEDTTINVNPADIRIFRKHLSEMIKRQQSGNKYATRLEGNRLKVIRIS